MSNRIAATLGDRFRVVREKKKISTSQAAAATRMKIQHVEAIEANAFHKFAAPAYARGFIKLYAEYLGLDPAPLIREYSDHHMPSLKPSIVPDEAAVAARKPKGIPAAAAETDAPAGASAASWPTIDFKKWRALAGQKITAWVAAACDTSKRKCWKRAAMAACVVILALLVTRLARQSGDEAGKTASARPATLPESMSVIIQEPPDPYIEVSARTP